MDLSVNQRLERFLFEKKISQEELRIRLGFIIGKTKCAVFENEMYKF